jgi:hypothetical protein
MGFKRWSVKKPANSLNLNQFKEAIYVNASHLYQAAFGGGRCELDGIIGHPVTRSRESCA